MSKLFISHSSQDDAFVRDLRTALADHGQDAWMDSRELRGAEPLWAEIKKAIEEASAYAIVVSPDALQSKWVGRELRHALATREERGADNFPVIPFSLNGTKLGVLEAFFGEEPIYIPVSSDAGGVEAAVNALLVAVRQRLPAHVSGAAQLRAEPLEELVLELTDLKFVEYDGVRRASARARLAYKPATASQLDVHSAQSWRLIAPIGPIETEELRWYLEKYAIWPSRYFRLRARKVEENLVRWGQLLHKTAMPVAHTAFVMNAWARAGDQVGRRFSVYVDTAPEADAYEADVKTANEAATLFLALPWELLHNGENYLFQGAKPVRVRRRLPNTKVLDVPVVATPIRILLVTARPEDDSCSYIDHRASALPLVEAMESLPGQVKIHVLSPPTLSALRDELGRARNEKKPYHVVHFDGHGVYDRHVGLGALCFEDPEDIDKLGGRRHVLVSTNELGPLLRDHRIPLVFLEACLTAQAEASESVASELLKIGVASVVAMSHSVLVETSRRFVEAFYETLAGGERVGDAMLAGQRQLKDDTFRGRIFGAGELRLEDWFVPVLYQEKDDPQLFKFTPTKQTQEDFQARLAARLGDLPAEPETGFIGRSRELLALQRLLREERYAVVRGQGGEGKTALVAEFARWMVRSQQMNSAAFVSVEGIERNIAESILDKLGHQLVKRGFSTQADCNGDLMKAEQHIARALCEQPTLLVIDNMESVLLPPFMEQEIPDLISGEAREELKAILAVCERLLSVGETRLVFSSREALPSPFDARQNHRELFSLEPEDAVKLVERVLNAAGGDPGTSSDAAREEIEQLVEAVHCHARTLVLLAPTLREHGVGATRKSLVELSAEMEKRFPGDRERSLFASVELSLRRLSSASQDRARVLAVFHGGVQLGVLKVMMQWEEADVTALALELVKTGLATLNHYNHLTLSPALCPYLRGKMNATELEAFTARWVEAMLEYCRFLVQQQSKDTEIAAALTMLDLPNLFALLDMVQSTSDAETTIDLTTSLYQLLQNGGKPRLLQRVAQVRDAAVAVLGDAWTHSQFQAARTSIEQQLAAGRVLEALRGAQQLLQRARDAGEQAYLSADYDAALACVLLARTLKVSGRPEESLSLLEEALERFEAIALARPSPGAESMASRCFSEKGACLWRLGRLDEAVAAYEEGIKRDEKFGDARGIAVGKAQIGSIRSDQRRYPEALLALAEARERFTQLDEPGSVAVCWHQIGNVNESAGNPEAAEDAYRKSLSISVRLGDISGQSKTLVQLANLYDDLLKRPEEAVAFYRQAIEKYVEVRDVRSESLTRSNLGMTLLKLGRIEEARLEVQRAIECKAAFGHATQPWNTWAILAAIETEAGESVAATKAKRKAVSSYLAYRRDGGENYDAEGRLSLAITKSLLAGDPATAKSLLDQLAAEQPDITNAVRAYIRALQAIVAGSRERTLADEPKLNFYMAAEILLLIETLEKRG